MAQVVDPRVSRSKFEREVANLRRLEGMLKARGWWIMSADFPIVQIAFATPKCRPIVIALCARIDFTNYDLWPPSVVFIDMFTGKPLELGEVIAPFNRGTPTGPQRLLQGHPGKPAFLCLPGVREYHDHPAHSGDSWLLHRGQGEGGLQFIVDKISTYGSESITGLEIQIGIGLQQGTYPA